MNSAVATEVFVDTTANTKPEPLPATVWLVTPELARTWLAQQRSNRPLSQKWIGELADIIRAGAWRLNGETIIFDEHGALVDGQHRLHAVTEANQPIQSYVVGGIAPDVFPTIDIGRKRTPGDIFAIWGETNSINLAAGLRWLWRYENGFMVSVKTAPTPEQLKAVLDRNPTFRSSLSWGKILKPLLAPSIATVLHYLFTQHDPSLAKTYFRKLAYGENLERGDVLYWLRERLLRNRQAKAKLPLVEIAALMIKAWNAEREGRRVRTLRWRREGDMPEDFPIIQ